MASDDEHSLDGERTPLLSENGQESPHHVQISHLSLPEQSSELDENDNSDDGASATERSLLWRLYVSHFLSTWNMRSYEFTVILLFATAYPTTLLPTSIRGVLTNLSTLFLSPALGRWVDRNASDFRPMRDTIVVQRVSIVTGCALWALLFSSQSSPSFSFFSSAQTQQAAQPSMLLLAILIGLGIVERICAVANNLVMERDWVPTIGLAVSSRPGGPGGPGSGQPLYQLNAVMRRIDLVSKILAPVAVSAVQIRFGVGGLVLFTGVMNLVSVGVELATARSAWAMCRALKVARQDDCKQEDGDGNSDGDGNEDNVHVHVPSEHQQQRQDRQVWFPSLRLYLSHRASLASLSSALQSFSVLSLSGPMTTYLLTRRHYSLSLITTARTFTSVIEIGATVLFPLLASLLTAHPFPPLPDPMAALGLAGVSLQFCLLVPCLVALAYVPGGSPPPSSSDGTPPSTAHHPAQTALLFATLALSRLGHWTHNLAVQQVAQTRVPAAHRVEFAGVEAAVASGAEVGRWACSAVWDSGGAAFWGVAGAGLGSVALVWALFGAWVWGERREAGGRGRRRVGRSVG